MKFSSRFNAFILIASLLVGSAAFIGLWAQPVDADKAKFVAERFFTDRLSQSSQTQYKSVQAQDLEFTLVVEEKEILSKQGLSKNSNQALPLYYIFNVKDHSDSKLKGGFIIISADQRIPVVLGYSFKGEFPTLDQSSALKVWMDHYKEQILHVIKKDLNPDPETKYEWRKYSGDGEFKSTEQITEVVPLLTTTWTQNGYYNNLCPSDARCNTAALNGHVPAGCAAVAMAQIMKFWNYPESNDPIPGYDPENYDSQPAIGVSEYGWANMPTSVDAPNPEQPTAAEIEAVSTLVYHCGVALEMKYSHISSGAGPPTNAFVEYFKYSPDIQDVSKDEYEEDEWRDLLRNELDNGRPIYYAGYEDEDSNGGHAWIIDGYEDGDLFHMNWGLNYNGSGNGSYLLNLSDSNYDYSFGQWANIGISPGSSLADADGNHYDVIEMGTQVWMAENLKTTKYNDGTDIAFPGTDISAWENNGSGAYAWYNNDEANKSTYGALYNWYAMENDNLCPASWHVPSLNDWLTLMTFLGDGSEFDGRVVGGGLLKEVGNTHWIPENVGASDAFGFTALPGGIHSSTGSYFQLETIGHWWASGDWWRDASRGGTGFMFVGSSEGVWYGAVGRNAGISVRCVRDAAAGEIPADTEAYIYGYAGYEEPGEETWFKFRTSTAGAYAVQTHGSTDTYMYLYDNERSTLIGEDNDSGSGSNAKIAMGLDANTEYYVRIAGNNGRTGSYSIAVTSIPDAPLADNVTVAYDGLPHVAGATVPAGFSIVWYDAATGGSETTRPSATNCGIYIAYAEAVNETTGASSLNRTTVTLMINPVELSVTADNQSSQYSDPLAELSYEITGFVNGENSSVVDGAAGISTTAELFSAPGEYDIVMESGSLSADNYTFNLENGIYTLYREDARVEYTGSELVSTTDATSGIAMVTLRATVQDITATDDPSSDIYPGDIRNARVRFLNEGAAITGTGTDSEGWMMPGLVNPSDLKTGVVALNWPIDIGVQAEVIQTVGVEVDYYYVRKNSFDNTLITIYRPSGEFITGGGFIINPENTEGVYAADPGLKTNFGFNVKFHKKGKYLKGNMNIIFRRTVDGVVHNFQIESKSKTSLGVNVQDAGARKAEFVSEATMRDLSKSKKEFSWKGLTLQVNMTDKGQPGRNDMIAISVYDKNLLLFSSSWTGTTTDEILLNGGNLKVHSGFIMKKDLTNSPAALIGTTQISQADFELIAFPNPFRDRIYFDLQLLNDSEVQLEIYDITGAKIATVYNGTMVSDFQYRFEYVPENSNAGTYIYRLMIDGKELYGGKLIQK